MKDNDDDKEEDDIIGVRVDKRLELWSVFFCVSVCVCECVCACACVCFCKHAWVCVNIKFLQPQHNMSHDYKNSYKPKLRWNQGIFASRYSHVFWSRKGGNSGGLKLRGWRSLYRPWERLWSKALTEKRSPFSYYCWKGLLLASRFWVDIRI